MLSRPANRYRRDGLWALVFLAPNFIGFLVFVAFPVGFSLVMAFTNWDLLERAPFAFVGLDNFAGMLWGSESARFWKYFVTTIYFMLGLPVSIAGSLFLAVLLQDPIHLGSSRSRSALIAFSVLTLIISVMICATGHSAVGLTLAIISGSSLVSFIFTRVGLRTLFYLPFFTTGIAQFILWKLMFRPDAGPINVTLQPMLDLLADALNHMTAWIMSFHGLSDTATQLLAPHAFHFDAPGWLGSMNNLLGLSPRTGWPDVAIDDTGGALHAPYFGLGARDAIVIMGIWATVGGNNLLLYLAGLSNVPSELYEAAMIDGAGRWRTFWNVSWPQLAPTTFFILIMSIIGGLQGGFEQARIMTEGRPADTTVTLGYYIFREGFEEFRLGYASAIAWMLFLMIFVTTLVNWRFGSRQINA
jgi:multiple sugar transport system permease protein